MACIVPAVDVLVWSWEPGIAYFPLLMACISCVQDWKTVVKIKKLLGIP